MRAEKSGIHLTDEDAAIIKGMIARGDRQHDIAAWFGVNGGRIAEISTGATFKDVPIEIADLPPPGPYISGRGVRRARDQLLKARQALIEVAGEIEVTLGELE